MSSINIDSPFVTTSIWLPEDDAQRMIRTTDLFNEFGGAINLREIGIYDINENITGQRWGSPMNSNEEKLIPFRRIYAIPSLTAPGTTNVNHNIPNLFFCTRISGTAVDVLRAPTQFIPLPQAAPDDVSIVVTQTQIQITCTTATYSTWSAIIILEYFRS